MKERIKAIQKKIGVTADGIIGPKTLAALEDALNIKPAANLWPTQAEVRSGNSIFGKAGDESKLVNITPAYPLYFEGKKCKTIRVHRLIAPVVENALADILEHYGLDRIKELGLDQYSGSYSYRAIPSGAALSMHAWGIALDFAAATNALNTHKPQATLSRPECEKWWEIWESYGAVSLGRQKDYDWMHIQFARLK